MINPEISIIIPVYNGLAYTRECLQHLLSHTTVSSEVIVIDNASTDDTSGFLQNVNCEGTCISGIHTLINKRNLGYAKACNQGYQKAKGQYIVFLNNDTQVTSRWLEPLLDSFIVYERAGMATPKLLYPGTKQIQYAGVGFFQNTLPYTLSYRKYDNLNGRNPHEVPAAGGACMVLSRKVLTNVGLFDEKFINGLEDIDLSLRIRKAGYKTIYCPESIVYHHESKTEGRTKHNEINIRYYLKKWQGRVYINKNGFPVFTEI